MGRPKRVPTGMPVLAEAQGPEREALSLWFKERIEAIQTDYEARIELLRTVGEHPSPVFAAMVREHALLGLEPKYIGKLLCVSQATLETHYKEELEIGKAEGLIAVGRNMFRIATSTTDPSAAKVGMSWLEKRGGEEWKPSTKRVEVEDTTPRPPIIDSSKLTFDERQQMRAILTRIADGGEGEPLESGE